MPEIVGSLKWHAAAAACLTLVCAPVAAAQPLPQPTVSEAPAGPEFIPRFDFHLTASALAVRDQRFSWDTHFGGSLDLVDYVVGRSAIYVDYEAVLGDEFRLFDPNQGNYTLEASSSGRLGSASEIVGIFHHVSRHLSDRPKRYAIAWNLLGARILHQMKVGDARVDVDLEGGKVVQRAYVDYDWIAELHLQGWRPFSSNVGVYGRVGGQWVGVTGEVPGRGRQTGASAEAGLRLKGRGGAMELFAGFERRVDADPVDRQPQNWALAGFRLLSR